MLSPVRLKRHTVDLLDVDGSRAVAHGFDQLRHVDECSRNVFEVERARVE
jgi:hypothetical protein